MFRKHIASSLHTSSELLPHIIAAAAILVYILIQIQHFTPAYQETDPDGYLFLARQMARLQSLSVDDDPFIYQSHVWVETSDGKIMPKFAPGYPFLMALFRIFGGYKAMFLVSPLMGGLALVGAYLLFLLWMPPLGASLGIWALVINPMYCIYSGYLLTHATNTCFIVWGMYFLWKWVRGNSVKCHSILAGLLLGFAAAVRYSSALLAIVLLVAVISRLWEAFRQRETGFNLSFLKHPTMRRIYILLGCYAIFPLILAIYNWKFFGSPFTTGYGLTHEQDAFTLGNLRRNLNLMIGGLNTTALYLIFPVGLMGMLIIGPLRERLMRIFWLVPTMMLYTSYYWALSGMPYLRFMICTFPVIIGSAFLLLNNVPHTKTQAKWLHRVALISIIALLVFLRYGGVQSGMRGIVSDPGSRAVANGGQMLSENLESDAVIFSQGPFYCCIGAYKDFRHYDLARFNSLFSTGERRHPKRTEYLSKFFNSLDEEGKLNKKREWVQKYLDESRQVAFFIPENAIEREQGQLGENFSFTKLREWQADPDSDSAKWVVYEISKNKGGSDGS